MATENRKKMTTDIPISYVFVEDDRLANRATLFHLLIESEISLLRCFMTLLLLPANTARIISELPPFVEAITRAHQLPAFRKTYSVQEPPEQMWNDMLRVPLLVLMVGYSLPSWFDKLIRERPVAVLSPSQDVVADASKKPGVFAGELRGMEDVREFYRVLRALAAAIAEHDRHGPEVCSTLQRLSGLDLFANRSKLDFIPAIPLPQPAEGRPATYLLNRLSNNVDEPALMPKEIPHGVTFLPQILNWSTHACAALSLIELGEEIPAHLSVSHTELEGAHKKLMAAKVKADDGFHILSDIGNRLVGKKGPERPFIAVPAPRLDLLRGKGPEGIRLDPDHKERVKGGRRAVADLMQGKEQTAFGNEKEKRTYEQARFTFLTEQRLLACQTACLAARCSAIPTLLTALPGQLYNVLNDLNDALVSNSRKLPELFQRVELLLSELLPKGLTDYLEEGDSPVIFFSDLPLEWTLVGKWPLCLTRPVSRIPLGFSHWDVLCAALEQPVSIDTGKPERVLVLDLIESQDAIRSYTDMFISASGGLSQNYTYASPKNAAEFKDLLGIATPDIVVLDGHGRYDRKKDELRINLQGASVSLNELLPDARVPPVWILSSCDTSVPGSMRGCFVRKLLAKGAVCVIATLSRVDAFTASMFVGRLLTEIYNPIRRDAYKTFSEVFFATQYTTALLYDPLRPLFRRAEKDLELQKHLSEILGEFFRWAVAQGELDVRKYRFDVAVVLGELLARHGLTERNMEDVRAGRVRPETLLFTAFGVPGHVRLKM